METRKFFRKKTMEILEVKNFQITQELNSMMEVEKLQEKLSIYKAHLPLGKLFFLGVLAGWWCGLAVILVVTIAGGIPVDTRNSWPCLPKVVAGFFFPVAIFLIIVFGGELFTGNTMSLLIGLFAKRVTVFELAYNWSVVLVSNFVGCVLTVYVFAELTELFHHEPWQSYVKGIAVTKINLKPEVAFLRAIPANALVCTSVLLGQQARDMIGKLAAMWFPIMMFAISGFEHAIANMAFVPLGLMAGAHEVVDYRVWLYQNLILVILGNIVGGGLIVGGAEYFLFDWTRQIKKSEAEQTALLRQSHSTTSKLNMQAVPIEPLPPVLVSREVEPLDSDKVRRIFLAFDADHDGLVSAQEAMCALNFLGLRCPLELLRSMMLALECSAERVDFAGFDTLARRVHELEGLGL